MIARHRHIRIALAIGLCLVATPVLAQGTLFVENDYVGIGIDTPTRPLQVVTSSAPQDTVVEVQNDGPARFRFRNNLNGETWNFGHQRPSGTGLVFSDVGDNYSEMLLDVDGNLTITGQLTTAGGTYPDYVFAKDYSLMSLADLKSFIDSNGHLPGVPTSEDIETTGGVNMSKLQLKLLEKVEELTLYTLDQDQLIGQQRQMLEQLSDQLKAQNDVISELRARLPASSPAE